MGIKNRSTAGVRRRTAPKTTRSSLADALFSSTQQRVLGLLFGQTDRSFFASEIINRVGGGSGAVQRELARLEQSGLVISHRVGNQKHFQANAAAPIFEELKRIVVKTFGLAEPIARALEPLRERIVWAVIYGSVAKQADSASSDIDILLVSDQVALEDVFNVLDPVERQLQRKINPVLLTSAEFAKRAKSAQGFVSRVIQGEYLPIMGDRDVTPAAR